MGPHHTRAVRSEKCVVPLAAWGTEMCVNTAFFDLYDPAALLSKANPLEEHKHLLTQRLEQRTKKRRPLCRKLREVLVIVLQDYR
jgi:hypothetical protein